jgi:hypothetical protein
MSKGTTPKNKKQTKKEIEKMKILKIKKVTNLKFGLNLKQFYEILDYVSEFHYYKERIIEESKRIDERNFEEVQWLYKVIDELLDSDLYKHIPKQFLDYDWEDSLSEANKVEEAWTEECIAEQKELERWYYSTRL